ncbi:MAG: hypothetical protein H7A27_08945 [Spirochaetaceae bacterium]|nr:hypothetical protein [Spirochaetaceae bacterium]
MIRYLVSALILVSSLVIVAPAAAFPAGAPGAWWAAAAEASRLASGYEAARTRISIEALDASGAVVSYERGETRLERAGGRDAVVVVYAEKDGEDASDDWRKRYAKAAEGPARGGDRRDAGGPPPGFDAAPFNPAYAGALSVGKAMARGSAVEVAFSIDTEAGRVEGVVSFAATGAALFSTQSWLEPPPLVSYMRSSTRYAYHRGALVVESMEIEGEMAILFVKRRFRMRFEFSEWIPAGG